MLKYFLEELSLIRGFLSYYRGEQAELRETLERLGIEVPVQGAASIKGSHADDSKDSAQLAAYLLSRASQPALVSNSLATLGSDVSRLELSRWLPIIAADAMLIGDHELARNALTRLNQLVPTHPVLDWVSLIQDGGLLAEKSNENELAAKDAERALEAGAVKYAERVFRRLVLANPEFASGWVGLGNVEAARGHHELAAEHYRRALQIANQNVEAQLGLADLMWGAGNEEEAATLYRAVARRCEANCPHRVSERAKLP